MVVHFKKQVSNHGATVIVEVSWFDHLVDRRRLWLGKTTQIIRINKKKLRQRLHRVLANTETGHFLAACIYFLSKYASHLVVDCDFI